MSRTFILNIYDFISSRENGTKDHPLFRLSLRSSLKSKNEFYPFKNRYMFFTLYSVYDSIPDNIDRKEARGAIISMIVPSTQGVSRNGRLRFQSLDLCTGKGDNFYRT